MQQMDPEETLRLTIAYEMGLLRQRTIQEVQRTDGAQGGPPQQIHDLDMNTTLDKQHIKEEHLDINVVTTRRFGRPSSGTRGRPSGSTRTSTPIKDKRDPNPVATNIIAE